MCERARIGALFAGYGGLEQGVQAVIGGQVAWVSDIDPGACRILAHRYPRTPNLGDISAVDWSTVEPVDVLTGGFPCQDVSHAGARRGLGPGTRSGLWSRMAEAIDHLRPSLVIAENVRGLLSASAASDVEPCAWCMGGAADGEPTLRALGSVLADLAELGYDASWHGLRAADVGAPHGRFRVFVLAWPAADAAGDRVPALHGDEHATGVEPRLQVGVRRSTREAAADPDPASFGAGLARSAEAGGIESPDGTDRRCAATADPGCFKWDAFGASARGGEASGELAGPSSPTPDRPIAWGDYGPAIRRWERRLGRPAPEPTEPGLSGQPRLSPRFVEWMMGLPAGWVTEVPDLTRAEQLKALGNGVVPQQAAAAVRFMLMQRGS